MSSMSQTHLIVSEAFKSVQGEGQTVGRTAYFIRLSACNLTCGISSGTLTKAKKDDWDQDKIKRNQLASATWTCDSIAVWMKGKKMDFDEVIKFCGETFIKDLEEGAHLVISGGEPLLQMEAIQWFLYHLNLQMRTHPIIEIETNATIEPNQFLLENVSYWNLSPKLANSGMVEKKRIVENVIRTFVGQINSGINKKIIFKFVIKDEKDLQEIIDSYVNPFGIPRYNLRLMPAADIREEYLKISPQVAEIVKKHNLCMSPREHVVIWDKRVGV